MRLIKLAAFALFGYALYEFFRGVLQDTQVGAQLGDALGRATTQGQPDARGGGQGSFGGGGGGVGGAGNESRGMNISGPGEGERLSTLETDGASVSHKVGRGVIR